MISDSLLSIDRYPSNDAYQSSSFGYYVHTAFYHLGRVAEALAGSESLQAKSKYSR
jgi:hypothetical protein